MSPNPDRCDCALCAPAEDFRQVDSESTSLSSRTQADDDELTITPLPKLQLLILILIQVAEPVTSTVIYPFVNDLVRSLHITHGDEKKTGYYVGLIESIFYAAEALTVLHWGRASDSIGRRPILLAGMFGLTISMLGFGLSKSYWMLLLSRCAQGAFNGGVGVAKSVTAEITDSTNAAQAISFLPVAWSFGSTLGPLIGGVFAGPADQWPQLFGAAQFFNDYPFFLPCAVATLIPLLALLLAFLGLKETLPSAIQKQKQIDAVRSLAEANEASTPNLTSRLLRPVYGTLKSYGSTTTKVGVCTSTPGTPLKGQFPWNEASPPAFRDILTSTVMITITNHAFLAFLDQSLLVLIPLFYSTPLTLGGLGLSPSIIGTILGIWGVVNGIVQVSCFAWIRRHVGHRTCYMIGIAGLGLCFGLFPVLSRFADWDADGNGDKVGSWVWFGIVLQLTVYMLAYMSYTCMFMYIAAAAPNRSSLGATNGLAQLVGSSVRALAPTVSSSLFSFSLELSSSDTDIDGDLVYMVLVALSAIALCWSTRLPKELDGEGSQKGERRQLEASESTVG